MQKEIIKNVKLVILALLLGFGMNYAIAATWTPPASTPPAGNTASPINVTPTAQSKTGVLGVGGLGVFGAITIQNGSQGAGKVLTSDATGLATWQTPGAGASYTLQQTVAGNTVQGGNAEVSCPVGYTRTGCSGGRTESGLYSILIKPKNENTCTALVGPGFPNDWNVNIWAYCAKIVTN